MSAQAMAAWLSEKRGVGGILEALEDFEEEAVQP